MHTTNQVPPASQKMAAKLAANRAGRLTTGQRRVVTVAGVVTGALLLCPLSLLIQGGVVVLSGSLSAITLGGVVIVALLAVFVLLFAGMIGTNAGMFLPEAFGKRPVRYARGPLELHISEKKRPELPFSYIIGDYSFAPYIAPDDVPMRPGAPYIVYYSARSRLLLSLAALDAPDAAQWEPEFKQ